MRTLDSAVEDVLASGKAVIVQLVKFAWPGGTQAINASNWHLSFGGDDYRGAAGLGATANVIDQPGELQGMQFEMIGVTSELMSLALDDADEVQDSPITVRTAVLDPDTHVILDAPVDWAGYADVMNIAEDGEQAAISLTAESKGVDLLRGNPRTYSDADHQTRYPGDRLYEYVVEQADKPVVWPEREWYFK